MDAVTERHGQELVSKHQILPGCGKWTRADAGRDGQNLFRETECSGTNRDGGKFVLPFQITTSRIGNHTG